MTLVSAIEASGTSREYLRMSPTDIHIIHAAAAHSVRLSRNGRRAG